MALKINQKAPDFTLFSTKGKAFNLSRDMQGKPCIIYFYPKNFTPGCTKEACGFRDARSIFEELDIPIFGISRDSKESHLKFRENYKLPYHLLSDENGQVCRAYKALIPFLGIPKRITYLLDKNHKIVGVYESMFDAYGHIKEMIDKLQNEEVE
ncbi:MAG: peroxiredoxin [Flammeovirgaceae bacterium]|nr:peroxiredoxin [Flammeovirgaceae bacterium]